MTAAAAGGPRRTQTGAMHKADQGADLYAVAACQSVRCSRSAIRWVPSYAGPPIPLDHGRDPNGLIVLDRDPQSGVFKARAWVDGVDRPDRPRYTVHWTTCSTPALYAAVKAKADPRGELPPLTSRPDTAGPCSVCGTLHPHRYGPGASPLCDDCGREAVRRWTPAFRRLHNLPDLPPGG